VRTGLATGNHGRILRLDRHGKQLLAALDDLRYASDRAAGADSRHKGVDLALQGFPDFLGCRAPVNLGIRRVLELLRHEGLRPMLFHQLLGPSDGPRHALGSGRQDNLGPKHAQQDASLDGHGLGHGEEQLVALRCRDESEGDARVAGGGLDDDAVLVQFSVTLGRLDHRLADTVLDARERIEELAFDVHRSVEALGDLVEFHQRRVAYGIDDACECFCHGCLSCGYLYEVFVSSLGQTIG